MCVVYLSHSINASPKVGAMNHDLRVGAKNSRMPGRYSTVPTDNYQPLEG